MALPDNFSPFEHLQSVINRVQNRIVRKEFSDVGGDDWQSDITTSRGSLRVACTLTDNDTAINMMLRLFFYYFVLRKCRDLFQPVYGSTIWGEGSNRKHKPQIMLFFQEDFDDVESGYTPITGEISFRLMDETSTSITESEMNSLALKVKNAFATGNGYVWKKGKDMVSYTDWSKGYQMQLLCKDKQVGKDLINKVLGIQNHTPSWGKMNHSENENITEAFPIVPGNQTILGKSRKKKRSRPIGDVRFQYAILKIDGLPNPIPLVDRSGILPEALELVY